jgi:hypothetical protein
MAVTESMEEPNRMEVVGLRGWRSALVRVVAIVRAEACFDWLSAFAATNETSNAMPCRGQRDQWRGHGRVSSIRTGLRRRFDAVEPGGPDGHLAVVLASSAATRGQRRPTRLRQWREHGGHQEQHHGDGCDSPHG